MNSIKIVTFFAFLLAMSHTECSTDCGLTRAPPPEVRSMLKEGVGGDCEVDSRTKNDASEDPGCV